MPSFHDSTETRAAAEDVWKLLYDPARFPDWWAGMGSVDVDLDGADGSFTLYPEGYPDFPMAQLIETSSSAGRVTVSCLVSDLRFDWVLAPLAEEAGTRISVDVEIPPAEAARLEGQQALIRASLQRLAALAAAV